MINFYFTIIKRIIFHDWNITLTNYLSVKSIQGKKTTETTPGTHELFTTFCFSPFSMIVTLDSTSCIL